MVSHCQLAKNPPLARLGSQNMPAHRQRRTLSTGNWFTQHGFPLSAYRELLGEIAKHAHACFHLRHLPHLFLIFMSKLSSAFGFALGVGFFELAELAAAALEPPFLSFSHDSRKTRMEGL